MSETRMSGGATTPAGAHAVAASGARPGPGSRPRLGVLDFNPIQYRTPLYQLITCRARVELDVLTKAVSANDPQITACVGIDAVVSSSLSRTTAIASSAKELASQVGVYVP